MDSMHRAPLGQTSRGSHHQISPERIGTVPSLFFAGIYCLSHFAQQVAEFFAPILLIFGVLWKVAPLLTGVLAAKAKSVSGQSDLDLQQLGGVIPTEFSIGGFALSSSSLLVYGFVLMFVAAIASTITVYAGRRL